MTELSTDAPPAGEANSDDELNPTALVPTTNAPVPAKVVPLLQGVTPTMAALARAATSQEAEDPTQFAEIRRICAVEVRGLMTAEEVEVFSQKNLLAEAYAQGYRFFEPQARGALYFDRYGSLFVAAGCGSGKTNLAIMCAERYWRRTAQTTPRARNVSLLLIPPDAYDQFNYRIGDRPSDIQTARTKMPVTVPFVQIHAGVPRAKRLTLAKTMNGCFVMSHALMSVKDTALFMEALQPGLVIVDEAHCFNELSTARTSRLMRYVAKKRPRVVWMSGTLAQKSLKKHHHFMEPALGDKSPLPHSQEGMLQWAAVVDSDADPTDDMKKTLEPLVDWARHKFPKINFRQDISGFRLAQKLRTWTTPGVVATLDAPAPCPLILKPIIVPHTVPEQEAALWALMQQVCRGTTPNGDPIEDNRQMHGWMRQLTAGFYYKLTWPTVDDVIGSHGLAKIEAEDLLKRSIDRHMAHTAYMKVLREWFRDNPSAVDGLGRPLDTPEGVGGEMHRNKGQNVGHKAYTTWINGEETKITIYDAWFRWKSAGIEPGVDPFTRGIGKTFLERLSDPVPICAYKIKAALEWVKALRKEDPHAGALLWYDHQHVGDWLTKAISGNLEVEGGPQGPYSVMHCPAGVAASRAILDPKNKNRITIATWHGHGKSKNLQHYHHQLIVQWPVSASWLEQTLSRTHRTGQEADELVVGALMSEGKIKVPGEKFLMADEFDSKFVSAVMRDATYAQQIMGTKQRGLIARWIPLPKMFDQNTLLEMGFETSKLGEREERFLKEKFG